MILLATVGLATADAVTYTSLQSYLLARADDSVDAADNGIAWLTRDYEVVYEVPAQV